MHKWVSTRVEKWKESRSRGEQWSKSAYISKPSYKSGGYHSLLFQAKFRSHICVSQQSISVHLSEVIVFAEWVTFLHAVYALLPHLKMRIRVPFLCAYILSSGTTILWYVSANLNVNLATSSKYSPILKSSYLIDICVNLI